MTRRVGPYFVGGLLAAGIVIGLFATATPAVRDAPVPPVVWLILLGLLADVALQPLARRGRIEPITMNERALGVIGGGLLLTGIIALGGPSS